MAHIPQASERSLAVYEYMKDKGPDDVVTYAELESLLGGMNPQGEGRRYVYTALNQLRRDHNHIWGCVRSVGYRLLPQAERLPEADKYQRKARRNAHRSISVLKHTDPSDFSQTDRVKYDTMLSSNEIVKALLRKDGQAKVEQQVRAHQRNGDGVDVQSIKRALMRL